MKAAVLVAGAVACMLLAAPNASPRLLWNTTASVPIGLYRLAPPSHPKVGELVVLQPDPTIASFLDAGGWLPLGVPLLKPVAATQGQIVCRYGTQITIDGRARAGAVTHDDQGRPLPAWSGCRRLGLGEVFVLSEVPGSFDGRYFGPTAQTSVLALARPVRFPKGWTLSSGSRP